MVNESRDIAASPSLNALYTVEEQFLASKTGHSETCEDAIYLGPHFVAVIDGATAKTERRWNGETAGKVAARLIRETLDHIPADATHLQAFDLIISAIYQFYEAQNMVEVITADPVQRLMAAVAIVSFLRKEVWFVGDCQCLLDQRHIMQKKSVDRIASEARAMFLEAELLRGVTIEALCQHDTGRAFILPLLQRQSYFQNNPAADGYEYIVVDGFPIPAEKLLVRLIPPNTATIILASDGYPILKESLEESERALQEILHDDPLLFRKYKSTKGVQEGHVSFDDRAYVKLRLK
jgi:glycerophosphoryl diester phosphodiesterase